jgi:hypothetical protein
VRRAAFLQCTVLIKIFQKCMLQNGATEEPQVSGGTVHVAASLAAWRPTAVCICNMCRLIYVYVCIKLQVCLCIQRKSTILLYPVNVHVMYVVVQRYIMEEKIVIVTQDSIFCSVEMRN